MDCPHAFDTGPHRRLIYNLSQHGINSNAVSWIENILRNWKQWVQGGGSSWKPVTSGIPKGSVLGPLLFKIFINYLPDCVISEVYLFEDGTKIVWVIANEEDKGELQSDLNQLGICSKDWYY